MNCSQQQYIPRAFQLAPLYCYIAGVTQCSLMLTYGYLNPKQKAQYGCQDLLKKLLQASNTVQLRFSSLLLILLPMQYSILVHCLKLHFLMVHFLAGPPTTSAIRQEPRRNCSQTEKKKKKIKLFYKLFTLTC